jgi:sec-independent protein translocase protein TatB
MLDIGWSELLVIAVVLIVVVGPKDLPPMLRAFGRMSRKFTSMAGEFRKQFDDALNEADMGDLRQTISDVQRINPVHSLRDAMNPLRQAAEEIRSDIRKTVEGPSTTVGPEAEAEEELPVAVTLPEPAVKLANPPPPVPPAEPKTLVPAAATVVSSTSALSEKLSVPPVEEVIQVEAKPKRKAKTVSVLGETGAEPAAKPARKRAARPAEEKAEAVDTAEPVAKPRRKTTVKKDKA